MAESFEQAYLPLDVVQVSWLVGSTLLVPSERANELHVVSLRCLPAGITSATLVRYRVRGLGWRLLATAELATSGLVHSRCCDRLTSGVGDIAPRI